MKRFLNEIKRREVIKPLLAYAGISWLVLQVVSVVASFITVHPLVGPGVLYFLVFGFPVMVYLSWHFDFSFQGVSRTPGIDEEENPAIEPFGISNWVGLLAIVLVSGFIGVQYFSSFKDEQIASKEGYATVKIADSIAVLPFTDQSADKDQNYLALGLSEEITGLLGRSDGFKVSASRSSQILSERGLTPTDIGRRLNVQTVLTGSVRATGNRLRVRVELLDTESGRTLWTESFLRELKDIFDLENEISRAVVNLLQDRYIEAGDLTSLSATKSVDAYVMYLKGREAYRKQTSESMKNARTLFEQSIALDPEYAKAYVALADTLASLSEGGGLFGVLKPEIAATLAEQNLEKALVREPKMAEIYAVLGQIKKLRNQYEESLSAFDKALELNPNLAIAYVWKSNSLYILQRFDEAIETQEKARELDPLFLTSTYNLGLMLSWRGRYDEAEAVFENLKKDYPESTFPYQGLTDLYFSQGNYVGSMQAAQSAAELSPDNEELLNRVYGAMMALGLVDVLQQQTSNPDYASTILIFEEKFDELFKKMDFELAANPDDYWVAFEAGWYYAMFGDQEKAFGLFIENSETLEDADKYYMPYCSPAIEIAWAYQELGKKDMSANYLEKCQQLFEEQIRASINQSELIYLGARIYALSGNKQKAIEYLQRSIDIGWREWWTKHDPLLSSLKNELQYQTLIDFIDKDLAKQALEARALFQTD